MKLRETVVEIYETLDFLLKENSIKSLTVDIFDKVNIIVYIKTHKYSSFNGEISNGKLTSKILQYLYDMEVKNKVKIGLINV